MYRIEYVRLGKFDSFYGALYSPAHQPPTLKHRSVEHGVKAAAAAAAANACSREYRVDSRSRPIPGLVAAELIPRSRSMHERFDQRCEIPKSLRGRVRAFDVHAGKGRLDGQDRGAQEVEEEEVEVDERARAWWMQGWLAMRTCQEQRLASLPLPALSFAYLPCPLAFHLIRSLACRSPRALILASCRAGYI